MGESGSRIGYLEGAVAQLLRDLVHLKQRLAAAEQRPWGDGGGGGGSESDAPTLYTCTVPSALTGPATFTATLTAVLGPGAGGSQTVTVSIPGPTVAGKMGYVLGWSGTYILIGQSCT